MMYRSTKTYGHEIGLSACFRQHNATSHCRLLHGYALKVTLEFGANVLDENNWVVDFGSLKSLKQDLVDTFDHKLLVSKDDPEIETFHFLQSKGLCDLVVLNNTGCEAFAKTIFLHTEEWLRVMGFYERCALMRVQVAEHGANSATFYNPKYLVMNND